MRVGGCIVEGVRVEFCVGCGVARSSGFRLGDLGWRMIHGGRRSVESRVGFPGREADG